MIFNEEKILKDKDYFRLVFIVHLLLSFIPIVNLSRLNFEINVRNSSITSCLLLLILFVSLVTKIYKRKKWLNI